MTTHDFEGSNSQQTRPELETTIAVFGEDSDISEEHEYEKLQGQAYVNPKKYSFEVKLKVNGSKA